MQPPLPSGDPRLLREAAELASAKALERAERRERERAERAEQVARWRAGLPDLSSARTGQELLAVCHALDRDSYPFPDGGLQKNLGGFAGKPIGRRRRHKFRTNYNLGTAAPTAPRRRPLDSDRRGPTFAKRSALVIAVDSGAAAHLTVGPPRYQEKITWYRPSQHLPSDLLDGVHQWLEHFASQQQ